MRIDEMRKTGEAVAVGMTLGYEERPALRLQGEVFAKVWDDATGEVLEERHEKNVVTLDAGILAALLFKDKSSRTYGVNMLAVGTGATGAILSPNAADNRQRRLNAEVARKTFSSTQYRDSLGNAVEYPTNIIDLTTIFGVGEAVGPLNEMGLMSTISANPLTRTQNPDVFPTRDTTVDVSSYDILVNYLTMSVITKPATANFSFTWRLIF